MNPFDSRIESERFAGLAADPILDKWHVPVQPLTHCTDEIRRKPDWERIESEGFGVDKHQ